MKVTKTPFEGLLIIEPRVFEDARGYFFESYNKNEFHKAGIDFDFVQDNQSFSKKGVLRGLHFQRPPFAQMKLIRVLSGTIQDIVVDLRKGHSTFGKYLSIELSSENKKQLLIPAGFAHGFLVLSEHAHVLYKCDEFYNPESEGGLRYNDPTVRVEWGLGQDQLSLAPKDLLLPLMSDIGDPF